jgi:hypothetical protein
MVVHQSTASTGAAPDVPEGLDAYVGMTSELEWACEAVEPGAVRRHAQAVMDEDPAYGAPCADNERFGGPIAPPLFPLHMFRRPLGTPDPVQANATDPDWDGSIQSNGQTLPPIEPLRDWTLLNGGSEVELFRYARHGERIRMRSRYADIRTQQTRKGPSVLVIIEIDYETGTGEPLMRVRRTLIRRRPK